MYRASRHLRTARGGGGRTRHYHLRSAHRSAPWAVLSCDVTATMARFLPPGSPAASESRCTLTVAADRIYARFGSRVTHRGSALPQLRGEAVEGSGGNSTAFLCVSAWSRTDRDASHLLASPRPTSRYRVSHVLRGQAAVRDGRAWIARMRLSRCVATTSIEDFRCRDGHLALAARCLRGPRAARRSAAPPASPPPPWHDLTSCMGSHSGAVVALDAVTGNCAWAVRYPRRSA